MKVPKYLLRIAGSEFVVPDSSGIATLIRAMEDAVPVHARLSKNEIELTHSELEAEEYRGILDYVREVTIRKIPAGVVWKRKNRRGEVEIVRVVEKPPKALPAKKQLALRNGTKELPRRKPWTALPPRTPQLALGL